MLACLLLCPSPHEGRRSRACAHHGNGFEPPNFGSFTSSRLRLRLDFLAARLPQPRENGVQQSAVLFFHFNRHRKQGPQASVLAAVHAKLAVALQGIAMRQQVGG